MVVESQQGIFDDTWHAETGVGLSTEQLAQLAKAAQWAQEVVGDNLASTGESLLSHAARVAVILANLKVDAATRIASLLTIMPPEAANPKTRLETIQSVFGQEVVTLVDGSRALLRVGNLTGQAVVTDSVAGDQKEKQRQMLLAMAADLRIVLMRLASRLQTLVWYAQEKVPCPEALAQETLSLYTPLANRLGVWQVKWEMEDLAFRFLHPQTYKKIATQLEEKRAERETFIAEMIAIIQSSLAKAGIPARVTGRPKHIYSIWNKMQTKNLQFRDLSDLRALRIIVESERDCYGALALVHALWTPESAEYDDYISRPKPNGYRSLHTVVSDEFGRNFEIQIRTEEMHYFAEYGLAAHWRYKEAGARGGQESAGSRYDKKIARMRQLLAGEVAGQDLRALQSSSEGSSDAAADRVYVLTPQGRVIDLPMGATPVDFAYHLHTDLGHRCRGAKVDGQMVPLLKQLKTGQTVEVITTKSGGPSRDWLNPQLGYLVSSRARAKVRGWFNAVELQERISQGQTLVDKELQRLGKTAVNQENLATQLGFSRADDLYVAVAKEEFSLRHIDSALRGDDKAAPEKQAVVAKRFSSGDESVSRTGKSGVLVVGVDSLLTQLAGCCRPVPPDAIVGFVTRGRGVTIHRADCRAYAVLIEKQPERQIEVDWGETGQTLYPVNLSVRAPERPQLLRDLSEVFARLRINVVGINTQSRRTLTHLVFTIEVKNGDQIRLALNALNELKGVSAERH